MVVPVSPLERGELDVGEVRQGPSAVDLIVLVQTDRGLGEGVVVAVADGPDGRVDAGVDQAAEKAKTEICHIDEGFAFLGFRIQPQRKRGAQKVFVLLLAINEGAPLDHGQGQGDPRQGTNQPLSDCCAKSTRRCVVGRSTSATA